MGRAPVQEPTASPSGTLGGTKFEHPAFGLIAASRVSGVRTLFGTEFEHHNYISLSISRAELHRDLSHDWPFARKEIVEVALSEAQWATFVSSLNVGQGVQCTLDHIEGKPTATLPLRRSSEVTQDETRAKIAEFGQRIAATRAAVEEVLGPSVSGKKKEAVLAHLARLEQDITRNIPWYAEVLEEQMHKTVEAAKVEVSAHINAVIARAGIAALGGAEPPIKFLPPTPTEEG